MATSINSSGITYPDSTTETTKPVVASICDQTNSSTGYFMLPKGTTAQRPGSPTQGMIRYNTTENQYEVYTSDSDWFLIETGSY